MLRRTLLSLKISKVAIGTGASSLSYTHNYRKGLDYNLSKRFARVTDANRFEALRIIFGEKLNGHVGRRQYKMQCAGTLVDSIVEPLAKHGIDWHDLKGLGRAELLDVCDLLGLDSSTRTVFLAAVEAKMCGVLTRSGKDRNPRTICMRPGRLQHGWRCGHKGHSHNVYFEGKADAVPSEIAASRSLGFLGLSQEQRLMLLEASSIGNKGPAPLRLPRGSASLNSPAATAALAGGLLGSLEGAATGNVHSPAAQTNASLLGGGDRPAEGAGEAGPLGEEGADVVTRMENGICVEHRKAPDFSIVGRHQERQVLNPRVWTSPSNPTFNVSVVGIEMRVHPDDPRAAPQISRAHKDWAMHGEVVKHVVWEMLELYGVERPPQPLDMEDGELGEPDSIFSFSSAFWGSAPGEEIAPEVVGEDTGVISPAEVAIERRMVTSDGASVPWFTPPLPQHFKDGVPEILPFAPTLIVRGVYRQVSEVVSLALAEEAELEGHEAAGDFVTAARRRAVLERRLHYPLMDISVLRHPDACFWWNAEDEERAIGHILAEARKVPFALPFNLYIRVDPSRALRRHFTAGAAGNSEAASGASSSPLGPLSEAFASDLFLEMKQRQEAKRHYFDLQNFRASAWLAADPKGGVVGAGLGDTSFSDDDDVDAEPLFGARRGERGTQEIIGVDDDGDSRHPESFDEEVTLEASGDDAAFAAAPERSAAATDTGSNAPIDGRSASVTDDGDDDDEFPDINPPGWS